MPPFELQRNPELAALLPPVHGSFHLGLAFWVADTCSLLAPTPTFFCLCC